MYVPHEPLRVPCISLLLQRCSCMSLERAKTVTGKDNKSKLRCGKSRSVLLAPGHWKNTSFALAGFERTSHGRVSGDHLG